MSPIPLMSEAFAGWSESLRFELVGKVVDDFEVKETPTTVKAFQAVFEPIPAYKLLMKPENQRAWKWATLYTQTKLDLDWIVQNSDGTKYRVRSITDWRAAGYREYEVTEGVK